MFNEYIQVKDGLVRYVHQCQEFLSKVGAQEDAQKVGRLLNDFDRVRFNITILGNMNRGKSTLLNTMMERNNDDISPINSLVCTAAILKYMDVSLLPGEQKEKALVHFHEESQPREIAISDVRTYVSERKNSKNAKGVSYVDVYGKFPEWSRAVTFVDSPGLHSVHAYHDEIVLNHLPSTDALVVLIAADCPCDGGDVKMLEMLKDGYDKKVFFVLSKIDEVDESELPEMVDNIEQLLRDKGYADFKLYPIAAKPVYTAICQGASRSEVETLKREYGIAALEEDLEQYIRATSGEMQLQAQRAISMISTTTELMKEYDASKTQLLSQHEFDVTTFTAEKEHLEKESELLRERMMTRVEAFSKELEKLITAHHGRIDAKIPYIEASISESLRGKNFTGTMELALRFRKVINNQLESHLMPLNEDLVEKIEQCAGELDAALNQEIAEFNNKLSEKTVGSSYGSVVVSGGVSAAGYGTSGVFAFEAVNAGLAWMDATTHLAQTVAQSGVLTKLWAWATGKSAIKIAAGKVALAKGAVLAAFTKLAIALIVAYALRELTRLGLLQWLKFKLTSVLDKGVEEIKSEHKAAMLKWKSDIVGGYEKLVSDTIEANLRRVKEIEEFFQNDTPEERDRVRALVEECRCLCNDCNALVADINTLSLPA